MKLDLYIRFTTRPGQNIKVFGNIPELGSNDPENAVPLVYINTAFWKISLLLSKETIDTKSIINYNFILEDEHGLHVQDWGIHRHIDLINLAHPSIIIDSWNDMGAIENTFYTAPFRNIFLSEMSETHVSLTPLKGIHFIAISPVLNKGESISILGNIPALGNWNHDSALKMNFDGQQWTAFLDDHQSTASIEYKYIVSDASGDFIRFEHGPNRNFKLLPITNENIIVQDGYVRLDSSSWKGTGIAIPVFSLRSNNSLGVGEFSDIMLLVDWAKKVSIKMVQLLPVNDTTSSHTYLDSYPYAAISAFALHPLYINLEKIAGKKYLKSIQPLLLQGESLNTLPSVDYDAVMILKWKALEILFDAMHESVFDSKDFKAFFIQNKYWLIPYAAYSYLRDLNGSSNPDTWGRYSNFNEPLINELSAKGSKEYVKISVHYFIQYQLHCQLKEAHDYANENGIILKGDIAIGVHRNGVDAWMQPELYNLDMQAGAPPDDFAVTGQNWGFPTYNWKTMKHDGYAWWQQRFKQMSYYFDAFRIDHILGFFRIWSIPSNAVEGIMGHFVPSIPVHRDEITQKGIGFDTDRFCSPYITDSVLLEMAIGREKEVKHFLIPYNGSYKFKPEFQTQRKIENYFSSMPDSEENQLLKQTLFNLHSNVILWKDENRHDHFHFRFNAADTLSYKHLGDHDKKHLWDLYVDYFFKRQDDEWREEAMEKLPALKRSTDMLVCGEDLGMVPSCLPGVMSSIGLLSMEVQRMPKQLESSFFNPFHAPYLSVVTPSTHDMSTLREWWEEDRGKSQQFYNEQLGQHGSAPYFADAHLIKSIVLQHLWSPAMWSIFQLQDLFAMNQDLRLEKPSDERINIPGDSKHYWKFRMKINIEDLLIQDDFNNELSSFIKMSGRN
jgi:4-alpha-glucanotransferase